MKLDLFQGIFRGRREYPRMFTTKEGKVGYSPAKKGDQYLPLDRTALWKHLRGIETIGIYPLLSDETTYFIAADFDNHAGSHDPLKDIKEFFQVCQVQEMPCYIERSRSGKGYHAWVFFQDKVLAWKARLVMFALLKEAQVVGEDTSLNSFDRLFPNQDKLSGKGFGNLIALPLQAEPLTKGNTAFLDMSNGAEPYPDQWKFLETIERIPEAKLDQIIANWKLTRERKPTTGSASTEQPGLEKIINGCEFIKWCKEYPQDVKEPLWYGMISNLSRFDGGKEAIHHFSKGHPGYSIDETNRKIEHALQDTSPHTCEYIKKNGFKCSKTCEVNSPAGLVYRYVEPDSLVFPTWVMSGAAGLFAKTYATYLEPPAVFFYLSFLTCLGVILSNRITLFSEIQPQPRLFTLLLGESADDRKSTAIHKTQAFFKEMLTDFNVTHGVGSAEGLALRIQESAPNGLLLIFDEMKQFTSKCRIEGSVLLPAVSTLFEINHYENITKKGTIRVENAFISLLAASTLQTYETIFTPVFQDIGFINRLWIVPATGERKFSIPGKIPDSEKKAIKHELVILLEWVGNFKEFSITPEAWEKYDAWYKNLERSVHSKRIDTYALRLMPLLALNDGKTMVDDEVISKVIALGNWQLEVRKRYDPIDSDSAVGKMENRIRRLLTQPLGNRELKRRCNVSKYGLWFFETAIRNLERAGEVHQDETSKLWVLK